MKTTRQEASTIYKAAAQRVVYNPHTAYKFDLEVVEHILRAMLEVMTPEQRLQVLDRVMR